VNLGQFRRDHRRSCRSGTLRRSDTNATPLEDELRWPDVVISKGEGRENKKTHVKWALGGRSPFPAEGRFL
jgi:hypothetical protein